ncbi:putative F-box protein At1g23770 [Humulus lupulus]|uniref:putative F-box protein At1g23770 n=1 Tax=Humulus lupulus TaxID=3486 RepID=UPI002B408C15|nr:putative F-box protein At1g23770 [Humulus lupulus]
MEPGAMPMLVLESGFVGSDLVSGTGLKIWKPSMAFHYTLPEILSKSEDSSTTTSHVIETVVLKFQIMGRFVIGYGCFVIGYGSLSSGRSGTYRDELVLPLLIDLCAKVGFPCPPCFMGLPSKLKLKILELLPGHQIARMGCVSKELHHLSSNNNLWKTKFEKNLEKPR